MAMVPRTHASISATWLTWARRFTPLLAFLLLGAGHATAQVLNATWEGDDSISWGDFLNWDGDVVPTAITNVTINNSNVSGGGIVLVFAPLINGSDTFGGNFSVNSLLLGHDRTGIYPLLTIDGGGSLTSNNTIIGNISGPSTASTVTVSDFGSSWTNNGTIIIGNQSGQGTLNVDNLGTVVSNGNIECSTTTTGADAGIGAIVLNNGILQTNGTLLINNAGANFVLTSDFLGDLFYVYNGLQGQGTIIGNVTANGQITPYGASTNSFGILTFDGNLTLGSTASISLGLNGLTRGTAYSALNVGGNATLNGTLAFSLAGSFTPALGNTFNFIDYNGSVSGNFTNITAPALPGGLGWDVSNLSVNGTATVVPVFTTQPANASILITENATFTVATSIPTPIYQWQVSGDGGSTWSNTTDGLVFNGSTTDTLVVDTAFDLSAGNLLLRATTLNPTATAISNSAVLTIGTTVFWSGNDSTDWTDPNNWAPPLTPFSIITTNINTTGGNQPIIATNVSISNFTVGLDGNSSASTTLTVQAAGNLTTSVFGGNSYLGYNATSNGALIINGPNASVSIGNFTTGQDLFVGWSGNGNLTVSNGGNLTTGGFGYIGTNIGSTATANITGANSTWTTGGDLNVGYFGNATLTVGNGATVSLGNPTASTRIIAAALGNSTGAIILNNGTLTAANANTSLVLIDPRGSLSGNGLITPPATIAGNLTPGNLLSFSQTLSFTSQASLNFTLGGPNRGVDYSAVTAAGSIILGGNLNITLASGFTPYAGEVFNLFSSPFPFVNSFANVVAPALPNGLGLDTTNLTVNGNITAITVISNQTTSPVTVTETQNTSFFVTAVGPDPKYDWQYSTDSGATWSDLLADKHFSNVKGATVNLANATVDMSGHVYRCIVTTDVTSATSNSITLIVNPIFDITAQPAPAQSVRSGSTVKFTFAITSPSPLTYQWYYNGKPIKDGSKAGTTISGVQSLTLTITGATKTNNGAYTIVATSVLNGHTVGSNLANLTVVKVKPRLLSQPRSLSTRTGRTASFRVVATGDQTLSFQWQVSTNDGATYSNLYNGSGPGGSVISGARPSGTNNSTLIITFANHLNDGHYRLKVTNAAGSATSNIAVLTVK